MANLSLLAVLECNPESAPITIDVAKTRLYILSTVRFQVSILDRFKDHKIDTSSGCYSPARQVIQKLQESFDELKTTELV